MPHVIIRPATLADAPHIANVHVASWYRAYRGILPDHVLDTMHPSQRIPGWERTLTDRKRNIAIIVATLNNTVIGFASVGASDEHLGETEVQMLFTLYMDPDFQGHGVGKSLLEQAESIMTDRGARRGTLRVMTGNAASRRFYERNDWTVAPDSVRMEPAWGNLVETVRYEKDLRADADSVTTVRET